MPSNMVGLDTHYVPLLSISIITFMFIAVNAFYHPLPKLRLHYIARLRVYKF